MRCQLVLPNESPTAGQGIRKRRWRSALSRALSCVCLILLSYHVAPTTAQQIIVPPRARIDQSLISEDTVMCAMLSHKRWANSTVTPM